ncbi:MAG TPA: hypothetical protein VI282_15325 [Verrucomicrobiae bacterium]
MKRLVCSLPLLLVLTACSDPNGLAEIERSFRSAPAISPQKTKADALVKSAKGGDYFSAVSGLQTLRLDPKLTLDQLTAIQDAIGKMQSRLAEEAAHGNADALKHIRALQGETEPVRF